MKTELIQSIAFQIANAKDLSKASIDRILVSALDPYEITLKQENEILAKDETTDSLLQAFCMYKLGKNISKGTIEQYLITVNQLVDFVHKPFSLITTDDITFFMIAYKNKYNVKDSTMMNKYRNLNSVYKTLHKHGRIDKNPMLMVEPIKESITVTQPLSDEEIERVKIACSDNRQLAIMYLLLDTGCRASELCGIKLSDIDFNKHTIKIKGKGNKERIVGYSDKTALYIQMYLNERDYNSIYLFTIDVTPHSKLTKDTLGYMIRSMRDLTGIERLKPHLFRHTCATRLSEKGMAIQDISRYLGHADIDTTMRYIHSNNDSIISEVKKRGYVA